MKNRQAILAEQKMKSVTPLVMMSAMVVALVNAFFMDTDARNRLLSEPQAVLMLATNAAMLLAMASLYSLFSPRDASVQTDASIDLDSSFKSKPSSALFTQLVRSRDTLRHAYRITSEKIDDFLKQVVPYLIILFSTKGVLSSIPTLIQEIDNPEKRSIFLSSYLFYAALIFGSVQNIRHSKPHEPRRKDCETQVDDDALLLQPRF